MPQRILRPTLRQSKRWNRLEYMEQSFYLRLVTLADDYGRYEADAELLRSEAFPFGGPDSVPLTVQAVDGALLALASKGMLILYEVDGSRFLQLTRWQERPRSESKFPDPKKGKLLASADICWQMNASTPSPSLSPEPSPSLSDESSSSAPSKQTDEEWLKSLADNAAYRGIDIEVEYAKMQAWCGVNSKQPSRRRFLNWLNRCERPLHAPTKASPQAMSPMDKVLLKRQLDDAEAALRELNNSYESHQTWGQADITERTRLRMLIKDTKVKLGITT